MLGPPCCCCHCCCLRSLSCVSLSWLGCAGELWASAAVLPDAGAAAAEEATAVSLCAAAGCACCSNDKFTPGACGMRDAAAWCVPPSLCGAPTPAAAVTSVCTPSSTVGALLCSASAPACELTDTAADWAASMAACNLRCTPSDTAACAAAEEVATGPAMAEVMPVSGVGGMLMLEAAA